MGRISEKGLENLKNTKLGDKNPNWKGNKVSIPGVHDYIRYRLPRPEKCQCCNEGYPIDLANISQKYQRDISDWEWLCRRCHMTKDGRMKNLKQYSHLKFAVGVDGCL